VTDGLIGVIQSW